MDAFRAARRVVIATNPTAGSGRAEARVKRLCSELAQHGLRASISTDLGHVAGLVEQHAASRQLRAVIAAGGDGTVAELLNRLPEGVPLAVLSAGTENLLARYLRVSADPRRVAKMVAEGEHVRLDAGRANGRLFVLMASCGFDAEVVERVHARRQGPISRWSYAKPILESIRNYEYPQLRIHCGGPVLSESDADCIDARWAFVFNMPCYGGGLRLAPQARADDGQLDLCAFREGGLWRGLQYASQVALRRHARSNECYVRRAGSIRIESEGRVPYQLDGDPAGELPLELEVVPGRMTLIAPGSTAARLASARAQLATTA